METAKAPDFIIYFDTLEVPFKVPSVPVPLGSVEPIRDEDEYGRVNNHPGLKSYDIDARLHFASSAMKLVQDFVYEKIGKIVSIRNEHYGFGRGVLASVAFYLPPPLFPDDDIELKIKLANWTTAPLIRE